MGRKGRWIVVALGGILAVVTCGILAWALIQGTWWYSYGTDTPLDEASRSRVREIRDEVERIGTAPEAVVWLEIGLDPEADPTEVRMALITAREALWEADDPRLSEAAWGLGRVIQGIQATFYKGSPSSVPTLDWP